MLQCCSVWTSVAVRINASRPRHLQCCSAAHRQHEFSRILIFLHQDEKYLFFCLLQLPRQRDVTAAARYEAASGACCSFTFTVVREMQSSEPCCTLYCRYTRLSRSHAFIILYSYVCNVCVHAAMAAIDPHCCVPHILPDTAPDWMLQCAGCTLLGPAQVSPVSSLLQRCSAAVSGYLQGPDTVLTICSTQPPASQDRGPLTRPEYASSQLHSDTSLCSLQRIVYDYEYGSKTDRLGIFSGY